MLFELRQYEMKPGKKSEWLKVMEEEIIPLQVQKGMVIVGSFVGEEDENIYVWIRRFKDEEERKRLYKAVYESDTWKNEISPRIPKLLNRDKAVITRIIIPHVFLVNRYLSSGSG